MIRLHAMLNRFKGSDRARDIASRAFLAVFAWMWVLQILVPWWEVWREEPPVISRLAVTALTGIFLAAYSYIIIRLYFWRRSWTEIFTVRERWILRVVTAASGVILVVWQEDRFAVVLAFAAIATILTGPPRMAFLTAIYATAALALVMVILRLEMSVLSTVLVITAVFGMFISSQLRQSGQMGEMIEARYTEVRMAAAEERLRLAQDLHDVLGRTLSLITLKSELAHRLITMDPDRAKKEIRDVEVLARSAMSDVRGTVSRERRPILIVEIEDARQILDAAGIEFVVKGERISFPEEIETLFSWAVREGVTNVVRHSRASCCTISLAHLGDRALLTIEDDGGENGVPGEGRGSGLAGLRERAEALHGSLAFELLLDSPGHRLTLQVSMSHEGR